MYQHGPRTVIQPPRIAIETHVGRFCEFGHLLGEMQIARSRVLHLE